MVNYLYWLEAIPIIDVWQVTEQMFDKVLNRPLRGQKVVYPWNTRSLKANLILATSR